MKFFARLLFYPTLFWNLLLNRLNKNRRWWDWIDDTVLLGALPMRGHVPQLKALGIGAVVNTCDEYAGPIGAYRAAGIEQYRIPTVDFTPPKLEDLEKSVRFIQAQAAAGKNLRPLQSRPGAQRDGGGLLFDYEGIHSGSGAETHARKTPACESERL